MVIHDFDLKLPKIEHKLIDTNLTIEEKLTYIRSRALIAQFLHIQETAPEFFKAIRIIHNLNDKIKGISHENNRKNDRLQIPKIKQG